MEKKYLLKYDRYFMRIGFIANTAFSDFYLSDSDTAFILLD